MDGQIVLAEILVQTMRVVNSVYSDLSLDDSTLPHYSLYGTPKALANFRMNLRSPAILTFH